MRKFLTLFILLALVTPLFLLHTDSARADDFPTVQEGKKKPKPAPTPKPGPREGGADD